MANNSTNGVYANLYSTKAHVFQVDPETNKSWLQKGDSAIPVSLVAKIQNHGSHNDSSSIKRELKIIATDDTNRTVLDAIILPKTVFSKRSPKFGQWTDPAGEVYGLGFDTDIELAAFIDTFHQLQRDIIQPTQSSQSMNNSRTPSIGERATWNSNTSTSQKGNPNTSSEINGRFKPNDSIESIGHYHQQQQQQYPHQQPPQDKKPQLNSGGLNNNGHTDTNGNQPTSYPRSQSMFGLQSQPNNSAEAKYRNNTPEVETSSTQQSDWRDQLKYDNERLRQKLEESNRNAGDWHQELVNLRTNNVKLTQALQESKAHVEEWERELFALRNENKDLRVKMKALESNCDSDKLHEYKEGLQKLYAEEYEGEIRKKDDQIEQLQRSLEELELKAQNSHLDESATVVENVISLHQKQQFDVLNAELDSKINELNSIRKKYAQLVDKMYH